MNKLDEKLLMSSYKDCSPIELAAKILAFIATHDNCELIIDISSKDDSVIKSTAALYIIGSNK